MTPIEKNIIVVDESGKEHTSTYAKRAKGLVRHGRARWLDERTICLTCPPEETEDIDMESNYNNESAAPRDGVGMRDILQRLDRVIAQGDALRDAVRQVADLPENGGAEGGHRARAIGEMTVAAEETRRAIVGLLCEMYRDNAPSDRTDSTNAHRAQILEMARLSMEQVDDDPERLKLVLDFYNQQLERL